MDDLVEFLIFIVTAALVVLLTILLCMSLWTAGPTRWACEDYGKASGNKTEFFFWYGCIVTLPDGSVLPRRDAEAAALRRHQHRLEIENKVNP